MPSVSRTWDEVEDDLFGKPGTPERAENDARMKRYSRFMDRAEAITKPLKRVPVLGRLASTFWFYVITETNPLNGLEWAFLNDGMRPSLWHTLYELTHDGLDRYSGLYPGRAPRSRAEAERIVSREWEAGA